MAGKKLLVADDSLTIQKVIRLALSNEGYEIQAVSDGNDAVQQISVFRPDAVLIDVSLPGRSAFEVKRQVNEQGDLKHVKFVLMSSAFEKVDETQAAEVVFHGRLTKPFDPAHLRQVLLDVLARSAAPNPSPVQAPVPPLPATQPPKLPTHVPNLPPPMPEEEERTDFLRLNLSPMPEIMPPPLPTEEPVMAGEHWIDTNSAPPELPQYERTHASTGSISLTLSSPPPRNEDDTDIRHLTESTIKMSGLDEFQWNVQEPSLKPSTKLGDDGGNDLPITPFSLGHREQTSENIEFRDFPADDPTRKIFRSPPVTSSAPQSTAAVQLEVEAPPEIKGVPAPTPEMIEEIIRKQVQETLEKMAQKILPEVAERIIKQEIHRLLSERP